MIMKHLVLVSLSLGFALGHISCNEEKQGGTDNDTAENNNCGASGFGTYELDTFRVAIGCGENRVLSGISIYHADEPERILWQTTDDGRFVSAAIANVEIIDQSAHYTINDEIETRCDDVEVKRIHRHGKGENPKLSLSGVLRGEDACNVDFEFVLAPSGKEQLRFELTLDSEKTTFNRIYLRYASSPDERFYGFGAQFSYLNMKGRTLPILTQEQGIGRGSEPLTSAINTIRPGVSGDWYSTYAAVPFYLTNTGRSFFLENYEISIFNFEDPDNE